MKQKINEMKLESERLAREKKKNEILIENWKKERERAQTLAAELRSKLATERAKLDEERTLLEEQARALEEERKELEKERAKFKGKPGVPRGSRHAAAEWRKLEQERASLQAMRKNMEREKKDNRIKRSQLEVEWKRLDKAREDIQKSARLRKSRSG